MPNINLTDSRKRDAVVKAESVRIFDPVRYVGPKGGRCFTRRVLKATVDHDYQSMLEKFGSPEAVGEALVKGDPEVDIERFGISLWNLSRVYTNLKDELVFRIEQFEIVKTPFGEEKERRPRVREEANVDTDQPLKWTGTLLPKGEVYRKFVFSTKMQIVHVNGLTFDFLYDIAKELHDANALMLIGGGRGGKQPLVFRSGSVPYRGFLEGRVKGDQYKLILHLSNMELKPPPPEPKHIREAREAAAAEKLAARERAKAETAAKKAAASNKDDEPLVEVEDDQPIESKPAKKPATRRKAPAKAKAAKPAATTEAEEPAPRKRAAAKKPAAEAKAEAETARPAPKKRTTAKTKAPARGASDAKAEGAKPEAKKPAPRKRAPAKNAATKASAATKGPATKKPAPPKTAKPTTTRKTPEKKG